MAYYSGFEKDEEDIVIPFALSLYITSSKIVEQLPVYLECLGRKECPEVLGVDLDAMTSEAHWMRNYKLEHDMRVLNDLPLRERGIEFAYKGFKPETTLQLYEGIRQNITGMVAMLSEVRRLLAEAPAELYGNFYRSEKAACDAQPVINRFEQWKREVGVVTADLLKDKQAQEVAEFLKQRVLRFMHTPSKREIDRVDIDRLKEHLPVGYELPEEFPKCYARLMRLVTADGDTLRINYDCYGQYLHQFYYRLTAPERQSLIHLDLMLTLIRKEREQFSRDKEPLRRCIELLMAERQGDEPLFSQQSHWQAVYRILVDKGYCRDSDFDGFDAFILSVMPDAVNKPYRKDSVKNISQTDFGKPFDQWRFDPDTSKTRRPFDRMVAVATRFKAILEENCL